MALATLIHPNARDISLLSSCFSIGCSKYARVPRDSRLSVLTRGRDALAVVMLGAWLMALTGGQTRATVRTFPLRL